MIKSKMLFLIFAITFIATIILFSTKGKNWQGIESMIFPAFAIAAVVTLSIFGSIAWIEKLNDLSKESSEKLRPIAERFLQPWLQSGELKYDGQLIGGLLRYIGTIKSMETEVMVNIRRPRYVNINYPGLDQPIEISIYSMRFRPTNSNIDINFVVKNLNTAFLKDNLKFQNSLGWIYSRSQILFINKDQKEAITPENFQKLFKEILGSL